MKGKFATLIIAALSGIMCACGKKDSSEPVLPAGNYMNASLGGNYWAATDVSGVAVSSSKMVFTGSRNPTRPTGIQITISNYHGVGSYMLDTFNTAVYTENGIYYNAWSGALTITSDSTTQIKGNFQFTCAAKTITNGQFGVQKN